MRVARPTCLLWFRQDLRLADNPALTAAARHGAVVPLFILEEGDDGGRAPGAAKRWWLHQSLAALERDLARLGTQLVLRRGPAAATLDRMLAETGADAVFWNRAPAAATTARDEAIAASLRARGIAAHSFNAALLAEPATVATQAGKPYGVFTPFWKALGARGAPSMPMPPPPSLPPPSPLPAGDRLEDWRLRPTAPDWSGGLGEAWTPGEAGARARLTRFLDEALVDYARGRDRPDRDGTSMLSPHLALGEIGPRQAWHAAASAAAAEPARQGGADAFLRELGWREFSYHLLHHFPDLPTRNWRDGFDAFPWREDAAGLEAWQRGRTGYPIVDAGMRQLWRTGWMHNRVRMIAASFLIKDLLIHWRRGEAWFWDTLVDADLANNAASWQWVAGTGADAAPFFRVFNPVLQGRKFDPDGAYVRRYVPELARLPDRLIHAPWTAAPVELAAAGVTLGKTYPRPIVDHAQARERALLAYRTFVVAR